MRYITADDVVRAGACLDGVKAWQLKHGSPTALSIEDCASVDDDEEGYLRFAAGHGDGAGHGAGCGDGDGYGYGIISKS